MLLKTADGAAITSGGDSPPSTVASSCDDGSCFRHEMTDNGNRAVCCCTATIVG